MVERIGNADARKVDDRLSDRSIVEDTESLNAVVVVGNLSGIRKDTDKRRYVVDDTHKMPFDRLLNDINHTAHDAGIDV